SALSTFLHRPVQDDVADQATLRRARKKNGVAASEICGRCSGMESIGSDCGLHIHTPAVGHPLLPLLLALFSVTVAISVAARSFLDGCHPRGDCQLVRSSIRIPELLNSRQVPKHAAYRFPDDGRALSEQSPSESKPRPLF